MCRPARSYANNRTSAASIQQLYGQAGETWNRNRCDNCAVLVVLFFLVYKMEKHPYYIWMS